MVPQVNLGQWELWLYSWLDMHAKGRANGKRWEAVEQAALSWGYRGSRSSIRELKEHLIESGKLVCGTIADGIYLPISMDEVLVCMKELDNKAKDILAKRAKLDKAAMERFGPQLALPGTPLDK